MPYAICRMHMIIDLPFQTSSHQLSLKRFDIPSCMAIVQQKHACDRHHSMNAAGIPVVDNHYINLSHCTHLFSKFKLLSQIEVTTHFPAIILYTPPPPPPFFKNLAMKMAGCVRHVFIVNNWMSFPRWRSYMEKRILCNSANKV